MVKLESVLKRSNNNFDLIRLLAALSVIFSHSFYISGNVSNFQEPVKKLIREVNLGNIAVFIFFFLSGIFITGSFSSKKNHLSFVIMRLFRIFPALIICVIITVFVVGPWLTEFSLKQYFTDHGTWSYLVSNSLLYRVKFILPGVFFHNYLKGVVNGSLWTLPLEVTCYCFVFIIGSIITMKNKRFALIAGLIAIFIFYLKYEQRFSDIQYLFFLLGSLSFIFRKYIFIDYRIGLALIALTAIFKTNKYFIDIFYLCLIYNTLTFSTSGLAKKIKLPGDYSYGIYIYGFLIQQILEYFFPSPILNPYFSLIFSVPAICIIAALSWHFIEKPSLNFAKSIPSNLLKKKSKTIELDKDQQYSPDGNIC